MTIALLCRLLLLAASCRPAVSQTRRTAAEGGAVRFPTDLKDVRPSLGLLETRKVRLPAAANALPSSAKQTARLRGGGATNRGHVEVYDRNTRKWRLLCDPNSQTWSLQQAQVVCRQLGYEAGVAHHGTGSFLPNDALASLVANSGAPAKAAKIRCSGAEAALDDCQWSTTQNVTLNGGPAATLRPREHACNALKDAVAVACNTEPMSKCSAGSVPFRRSCYRFFPDAKKPFEDAEADCRDRGGGHLAEIKTVAENTFLFETLQYRHSGRELDFWTGGLSNFVAGKEFGVWYHSSETLELFGKRRPAVEENQVENPHVLGLALSTRSDRSALNGTSVEWSEHDLTQRLGYVCQMAQKQIGCLKDSRGGDYDGRANRSDSGGACLRWSTQGLQQIFEGQSGWEHNFCRNPGGLEEAPICFVDMHNYDYCTVPTCEGLTKRRDTSSTGSRLPSGTTASLFGEGSNVTAICTHLFQSGDISAANAPSSGCEKRQGERFRCGRDELIFSKYVCDGERDCIDGEDERDCIRYAGLFRKENGFKIQYSEASSDAVDEHGLVVQNVESEEGCAKKCIQSKRCACNSFSYHPERKRCILTNRLVTPFDALLERKSWNYFALDRKNPSASSIVGGCRRVKRPAASQIEGIRLRDGRESDIVEVKINGTWGGICDDGFGLNEANVVCRQMGFHLGAEEVFRRQGKSVDDPIHLYGLECNGEENAIASCQLEKLIHGTSHICSGVEKAGVTCRKTAKRCNFDYEWHCGSKECIHINNLCDGVNHCSDGSDENLERCSQPLEVRLTDGGDQSTGKIAVGRVEVKHKGIWGTVCDDYFGQAAAGVVCKMLGFDIEEGDVAMVYNGTMDYRAVGGPVWVRFTAENSCEGQEDSLTECKERDMWNHDHHCSHDEDVAVQCERRTDNLQNHVFSTSSLASTLKLGHNFDYNERILDLEEQPEELEAVVPAGNLICGQKIPSKFGDDVMVLPRIHGGVEAEDGEHPWQASVRVAGQGRSFHWCGASIVSRFHVITAAHCVQTFPASYYVVRIGDYSLDRRDAEEQEFAVETIHFHEDFNLGPYLNNDIAVIKISPNTNGSGFDFGPKVSPICLPPLGYKYIPTTNVTITGWGRVDAANRRPKKSIGDDDSESNLFGGSDTLKEVQIPLISQDRCDSREIYGNNQLSDGMFCAGMLEGGGDACKGDSGGPAVAKIKGKATLLGITSWGLGCGLPYKPGVYTRVGKYVGWIQRVIAAAAAN